MDGWGLVDGDWRVDGEIGGRGVVRGGVGGMAGGVLGGEVGIEGALVVLWEEMRLVFSSMMMVDISVAGRAGSVLSKVTEIATAVVCGFTITLPLLVNCNRCCCSASLLKSASS